VIADRVEKAPRSRVADLLLRLPVGELDEAVRTVLGKR